MNVSPNVCPRLGEVLKAKSKSGLFVRLCRSAERSSEVGVRPRLDNHLLGIVTEPAESTRAKIKYKEPDAGRAQSERIRVSDILGESQ